jgi:hypothetical protein
MPLNIAEDALEELILTNSTKNTSLKTIKAYLSTVGGGTGSLIGTASGAAAGVDIPISLDFAGFAPGEYVLEVFADFPSANPLTLIPNDITGWPYAVEIKNLENI